ncbi:hypothetical protein [Clostridium botulinum]|uniref:hypothetical protein n=1 Tax=Clostridium botulinum TaxID=1491 RepID=UPI0007732E69|nr:hypothetical protein [Clostridium botulinum]
MNIERWTSSNSDKPIKAKWYKLNKNGGENMEATIPRRINVPKFSNRSHIRNLKNFNSCSKDYSLNCMKYIENDGSITLSLQEFDIVVNEDNFEKAIKSVINELKEYVEDYLNEPEYWGTDKERKQEVKFLYNLFENFKNDEIRDMIKCRNGKS